MPETKQDIKLSLIIPLYNRPDEIEELLSSLIVQTVKDFEVVVVEDGSSINSKDIVVNFQDRLDISYYVKENGGPGPARNFGAERAKGNYLIFLDSDCIIPEKYIASVLKGLASHYTDSFGGPDSAHDSFTNIQKSINYAMTSLISTGGIRGHAKSMEKFHPRSFNMGISKNVFMELNGFAKMRFGEDVDFSMRIMEANKTTQLIEAAFVYHKRRTDFKKFFKQVHNSGIARINLEKRHPGTLKLVHALPSIFVLGTLILIVIAILIKPIALVPLFILIAIIFFDSFIKEKNVMVSLLSVAAVFTQLFGYGTGFIKAFWKRIILKQGEFQAFEKNFYK